MSIACLPQQQFERLEDRNPGRKAGPVNTRRRFGFTQRMSAPLGHRSPAQWTAHRQPDRGGRWKAAGDAVSAVHRAGHRFTPVPVAGPHPEEVGATGNSHPLPQALRLEANCRGSGFAALARRGLPDPAATVQDNLPLPSSSTSRNARLTMSGRAGRRPFWRRQQLARPTVVHYEFMQTSAFISAIAMAARKRAVLRLARPLSKDFSRLVAHELFDTSNGRADRSWGTMGAKTFRPPCWWYAPLGQLLRSVDA